MLINTNKFAFAAAITTALVWAFCSLFVMFMPGRMTNMTGHMLHMDLAETGLTMSLQGFIFGFFAWVFMAGLFAWLLATIYNFTVGKPK